MNRLLLSPTLIFLLLTTAVHAQNLKSERILYQNILKTIRDDLKENYYDENLRGIDIEENFKKTNDLLGNAGSPEEMTDMIVRFLYLFDDSHVYFIPPRKTVSVDYGWELKMIGDKAFVTEIDEDSDAFKKGVRIGDQIYMIEGFIPTRKEFSLVEYHFEVLRPRDSLQIILTKPSGNNYKMEIKAKLIKDNLFIPSTRDLQLEYESSYADSTRQIYYDKIPGLAILKMPSFDLTPIKVDKMIDKIENKNDALILDLRGNSGGLLAALDRLIGNLFEKEITVGRILERKKKVRFVATPRGKDIYKGKLVVLIDSDSKSASEMFARVIQLEDRGIVIGDHSAGAVMPAKVFYHTFGLDSRVPYGVCITIADLVMNDGQRLEKVGVTPNETVLPTALDLANNRDPVLSRAAKILGFELSAEEAGKIMLKNED